MVKINGITYDASVSYSTKELMMDLETDLTYAQLESLFGSPCSIEIIENNETIAKFYSKELISISKRNGRASVAFATSIFEGDMQSQILDTLDTHGSSINHQGLSIETNSADINNADSALIELAAILDELEGRVEDLELAVFPVGGTE